MSSKNSQTFEVVISTRAELREAEKVAKHLENQILHARLLGKEFKEQEAQLDKVRGVIAKFKESNPRGGVGEWFQSLRESLREVIPGFEKLDGAIEKLASGSLGRLSVIIGAIVAALGAMKKGLNEYAETEEKISKLDAALAQTGQMTEEVRARFQSLASEMQAATGIADDQWLPVLTTLTQHGAVASEIDRHTTAVKNLAGLMGGDLAGATHHVAMAMQGQFQWTKRVGIALDENASKAQKLDQLYRELAQRGGGQLEASSKTLSGQFRTLGNTISDLLEGIGGMIAQTGVLQGVLTVLIDGLSFWADVISSVIPAVEGLENANQRTIRTFDDAAASVADYSGELQNLKTSANEATDALNKAKEKMDAIRRAQDEELDADMAIALAQVDQDEKKGKLTTEQALVRKRDIRKQFGQQRLAMEQFGLEDIKAKNQEAIDAGLREQQIYRGEMYDHRERAKAAKAYEDAKTSSETALMQAAEAESAVGKAQERLDHAKRWSPNATSYYQQELETAQEEARKWKMIADDRAKKETAAKAKLPEGTRSYAEEKALEEKYATKLQQAEDIYAPQFTALREEEEKRQRELDQKKRLFEKRFKLDDIQTNTSVYEVKAKQEKEDLQRRQKLAEDLKRESTAAGDREIVGKYLAEAGIGPNSKPQDIMAEVLKIIQAMQATGQANQQTISLITQAVDNFQRQQDIRNRDMNNKINTLTSRLGNVRNP